jgi:hypothetical protein
MAFVRMHPGGIAHSRHAKIVATSPSVQDNTLHSVDSAQKTEFWMWNATCGGFYCRLLCEARLWSRRDGEQERRKSFGKETGLLDVRDRENEVSREVQKTASA